MRNEKIMKKVLVNIVFNKPGESESRCFGVEADQGTEDGAVEVADALVKDGYGVNLVGVGVNNMSGISQLRSGVIFNLIEWTARENIYLVRAMKLIEGTGLPYTGSDIKGMLLSNDKIAMKKRFVDLKIPTPKYQVFTDGKTEIRKDFIFPVIVKPTY